MRRILIVALVGVMAFSAVAFAGWKFGAEQGVDIGGDAFPFSAYVGYDFYAMYVNTGPLSIGGDFVVTRDYNWSDSILSGLLGIDTELTFSYLSAADVVLFMDFDIDYASLPASIALDGLEGGVEVIGHVNDVLTLNVGVNLLYDSPAFDTTFYFGFDAAW